MKLYRNYCISLDLEDDREIRALANLILFGITLAERKQGFYLPETTIGFGKELLNMLNLQIPTEGTNNENN